MNILDSLFPVARYTWFILGLSRTGYAAAKWLLQHGATVRGWDDNPIRQSQARALGVEVLDPADPATFQGVHAMIQSPGIPFNYPAPHIGVETAQAAGVPILSDIDVWCRYVRTQNPTTRFFGITGTNGKSTTTALVAHILQSLGHVTVAGGNLGIPVFDLDVTGAQDYVLELSSYQLELSTHLDLDIGVFLNLTPDHLDRHASMEEYYKAKARLFQHTAGHPITAVVSVDDAWGRRMAQELRQANNRVIPVSTMCVVAGGVYVADNWLVDDRAGQAIRVLDLTTLKALRGVHNYQNIAAAVAAIPDATPQQIIDALTTFPGLDHRQQLVAEAGTVAFINDSKGTNPESTARALDSFDNIYWIVGGKAKTTGLQGLEAFYPKIRHAFLIGESTDWFATLLQDHVPFTKCYTLDRAVAAAWQQAQTTADGGVVLLSPACASWDQFTDFEARGQAFVQLVQQTLQEKAKSA